MVYPKSRSILFNNLPSLIALVLSLLFTIPAHATTITVNPGAVGTLCCTTALARLRGDAFDEELWISFDDMKHIEAVQWGFKFVTGGPIPNDVLWEFFLTDMHGAEIPDRDRRREGTGQGELTRLFAFPVIAHGIHLSFDQDYNFGIEIDVGGNVGTWVSEPFTLPLSLVALAALVLGRRVRARNRLY